MSPPDTLLQHGSACQHAYGEHSMYSFKATLKMSYKDFIDQDDKLPSHHHTQVHFRNTVLRREFIKCSGCNMTYV